MKFAHMADCHIGSWRDEKLRHISTQAFERACSICIREKVSFLLIAGDLFNTAIPSIDSLRSVVKKMSELRDAGIPVYLIAGSHDFSHSGRTMLDVLEEARLCINVAKRDETAKEGLKLKFTTDEATGAKIVGLLGRRGGLEESYYQHLDRASLENESGFKIFLFHSAIEEYKPKHLGAMEALPLSYLPKGFDYYAGGHVHVVFEKDEPGYGTISFPGPLFPNDFRELEQLGGGGFYIYEDGKIRHEPIRVYNVTSRKFDCTDRTPEEILELVMDSIKKDEFVNTIVTLRFSGRLRSGLPTDIDWSGMLSAIYDKGAYFVMKNASKLSAPEFEEIKTEVRAAEDIESDMIKEHLGQVPIMAADEAYLIRGLISALDDEKQDGERVSDFERRLVSTVHRWVDPDTKL